MRYFLVLFALIMMFVMLLSTQKVCFGSDQNLVDGQRSDIATGGLIIANIEFLIFSLLLRIFLLCSAPLRSALLCSVRVEYVHL